ncbi:hypothetical protein [Sagittula sp. S175]|uniref:hypothetical protein n=1 Tax=Sagittula sp. S175 TaxID=3415129 RepID=UPI003C7B2BC5
MSLSKALACAALLGTTPAWAADFSDPTWPCVQRKVENLSIGLMWPSGVPEAAQLDDSLRREVSTLADKLAVRRLTLEELQPDVAAFGADHGGDVDLLGLVFQDVFDSLSARRTRIIEGIGDFSLSQIALSEKIETARVAMDEELARDDPDFDKVDALEEQLDWDQTIYSDRQKNISYLCETPVLLEKRLYGLAQMLAAQAQ